jgi:hypothetical protein
MYELKDYLNAINFTKKDLMKSDDREWVKKYPAYIVNKILSGFQDTLMLVNEMNRNHFIDKDMQFHFLLNSILSQIKVLSFKEKGEWDLQAKYNIGKKIENNEGTEV